MDERDLQRQMQALIRRFGLLDQDRTPCGQPLPISQAHALQVLGESGPITQQELAQHLHLEKSTISRLVAQLVGRGWVNKTVDSGDRRAAYLSLSDGGRAVLHQVLAAAAGKYRGVFERIPAEQRPQVVAALATLTAALEEEA